MSSGHHVEGDDRRQRILLPGMLDEYVGEDNPVRFIDAFVDTLDVKKLGFKHSLPSETGRPSYDPADLLKLFIYGYLNQIRSSRKLERECHRNLELVWLMKKLTPDFKTISDFRKNNVDCIKPVFKEFVYLCKSLDLFGLELVGIDGSTFKAVNSKDRSYFNEKKLLNHLKTINERIERYLKELEENDNKNDDDDGDERVVVERLKEKINKLEEKKNEYIRIQNQMKETGQKEVSLTDKESRLMRGGNGKRLDVCYNVESAVDSKNHLVAEYYVTNHPNDKNELANVAIGAKENLGVEKLDATADSGFFDSEQIKDCVDNGITPYVTEQRSIGSAWRAGVPTPEFYKSEFAYDKEGDAYTCPEGEKLEFMYVMDKGRGRRMRVYGTQACSKCPFFLTGCTADNAGRKIYRGLHEAVVEEMRKRIKDDPSKVELRKELCEHPFGTMKRAFNQGYLLLKGLRKVGGEVGLTMLAYNMRRAINVLGAKALTTSLG
jgi:transposase